MSKTQYIVALPHRSELICIEADSVRVSGHELEFRADGAFAAAVPRGELVSRIDALLPLPTIAQGVLGKKPFLLDLEPGEVLDSWVGKIAPGEAVALKSWPAQFWPFLAGAELGLIAGIGSTLSHFGAW